MPRTNINYFFFCERVVGYARGFRNDIRLRNAFIELLGELFDALGLAPFGGSALPVPRLAGEGR